MDRALAHRGLDIREESIASELHLGAALDSDSAGSGDEGGTQFHALVEEDDRLQEEILALRGGDDFDGLHEECNQSGIDSTSSRMRSPWYTARFELLHDGEDPATDTTVLQAAFNHVEAVYRGSTIAQVEMDIKRALSQYSLTCGMPAPDNPHCRYPPSYYLCKIICDVGDLSDAEVHLCSSDTCPHMTVFPSMDRQSLARHISGCTDPECRRCHCPCGGHRMHSPGVGSSPQPAAPCYFFADVFQQFFLDSQWYKRSSAAHTARHGNFYSNPEGKRVLDAFSAAGVSPDEVRASFAWVTTGCGVCWQGIINLQQLCRFGLGSSLVTAWR